MTVRYSKTRIKTGVPERVIVIKKENKEYLYLNEKLKKTSKKFNISELLMIITKFGIANDLNLNELLKDAFYLTCNKDVLLKDELIEIKNIKESEKNKKIFKELLKKEV